MRTFLGVSASLLSLFAVACGGGSGGSGDGGGSGSTSTAGSGGTGGATMSGGSGGTGGSVSTGGTGGNTAGSGGVGGSTGAAFGQPCTMDSDCVSGLVCFDFNAKGKLCTHTCQTDTDCEAPSSGCNGMGYCKPN